MNKKDWQQIFSALGLLTQLGIVIVVNIGVGFFIGYWLDSITGKELIFKIIGLVLGIISGFYSDYRLIKKMIGDDNN